MDENLRNNALKVLENEQDQLDGVFDRQSDVTAPTKLTKVNIIKNDDGTWSKEEVEEDSGLYDESVVGKVEQQIEDDVKTLQQFCAFPDNTIVSFNAQINELKSQIASLSAQATSGNCWPGVACSTTLPGNTICSGVTTDLATYTVINQDRDALKIFQSMSGPSENFAADNPFNPDDIVTLSTSYAGYGYENVKQDDGGSLVTSQGRFDVGITTSDHSARRISTVPNVYYTGSTIPGATCVSIANSITALQAQIVSLRAQRDAAVNRTNLNAVKNTKKEKELQNWGCKNLRERVTARKTKNTSAIAAVQSFS